MGSFRAMGTEVTVLAPHESEQDEAALTERVAAVFEDAERRFSRFRVDSELSALNRADGAVRVSRAMLDTLLAARTFVARTRGLFDPAVGASLIAAGYDRSFTPGALDRDEGSAWPARARFDEVQIDEAHGVVLRAAHVQLDLGGFVKGLTVDRAARLVEGVAAIDAGGDAVLRGDGPDGDGWLVDVEDPADAARVLLTLRLRDRAVATSAPNRRRWHLGARAMHHLIDPRTGQPASTDLAQATVVASCAAEAEALAKAVFVLGASEGARFLAAQPACAGVLVERTGAVRCVGEMEVCDA